MFEKHVRYKKLIEGSTSDSSDDIIKLDLDLENREYSNVREGEDDLDISFRVLFLEIEFLKGIHFSESFFGRWESRTGYVFLSSLSSGVYHLNNKNYKLKVLSLCCISNTRSLPGILRTEEDFFPLSYSSKIRGWQTTVCCLAACLFGNKILF